MKQGIEIGTIVLNSQTSTSYFKESGLAPNKNIKYFFWLDGTYKIECLEGDYRIGLYFKDERISYIDIFSMDYEKEDQIRKNVLQKLKANYSLGEKIINYGYNSREGYGSVKISF